MNLVDRLKRALENGDYPSGASILENLVSALNRAEEDLSRPLSNTEEEGVVRKVMAMFGNEGRILENFLPSPVKFEKIVDEIEIIIEKERELSIVDVPKFMAELLRKFEISDRERVMKFIYEEIVKKLSN